MATETEQQDGFGEVSRLKGLFFEYLTFGASVVGILALAVLLAYVAWDAFGLWSAGVGWYLTYAATIGLPVAGFFLYANRNPAVGSAGLELCTAVLGGIMLGVALVVMLLIVTGGPVWFTYFLTVVAPVAGLVAYGRYDRSATWAPLTGMAALVVGPVIGTMFLGPISNVARLLGGPGVFFLSLIVPSALLLWYVLAVVFDYDRRVALGAAVGLPVVAIAGVPLIDSVGVLSRSVWLTLLAAVAVPVTTAVANTARDRERWPGVALPVGLVGGFLLGQVVVGAAGFTQPTPWLDWQFLTSDATTLSAEEAGLYPPIIGSVFLIAIVAVLTFVLGVGAAVYLEEYAPSGGYWGGITRAIQVNISNLAGVPSVVYGLLGLGVFVNLELALDSLGLGFTYAGFGVGTVLTAAFTLSLLILPIVIISAQEAIRSVPGSLRQASYGMGATRWQTTRNVVLPRAFPGILTGTILALGRAIGETAPLLMIGAATTSSSPPSDLFSTITAMPLQVYTWAFLPGDEFQRGVTAAGVVTLLVVLLTMNSVAILLRNRYEAEA